MIGVAATADTLTLVRWLGRAIALPALLSKVSVDKGFGRGTGQQYDITLMTVDSAMRWGFQAERPLSASCSYVISLM